MKVLFFLWKYKILKSAENLSIHPKEFYKLPKKDREKVLDKYFKEFSQEKGLETYFMDKSSRYYYEGREISFFNSYYFDKSLIKYNINCIGLIDEFRITPSEKDNIIKEVLSILKSKNKKISSRDLVKYPDNLPINLSSNIDFMEYLITNDYSNIKYITYNSECINKQRDLIKKGIDIAKKDKFNLRKFLKNDGMLPKILEKNLDFIIYLIENDIENSDFIDESIIENTTISNQRLIVDAIIKSLEKKPEYLKELESNSNISNILNINIDFIKYIININIDNIKYIDWHNLHDTRKDTILEYIITKINKEDINFDVMKYPFHALFFQNTSFMEYLIKKDFRWITVTRVNNTSDNNKLIDLFFEELKKKNYHFKLEDFLEDGTYFNHILIENEKMLHYFFINKVPVIKHIDFFQLDFQEKLIDNILKEIDNKNYEFHNEDFLVNEKYPIPLSNHYRFMRYVIDKNFNNIAYMDTSMIDKKELKRIINYAFRMVYYIRGNNKKLTFDIDGYFKNSDIIHEEYFIECLESL